MSVDVVRDSETIARINGVASQMSKFNFLFGGVLGEMILRHTDNLSKTLQNKDFSASEGQEIARLTIQTLDTIRNEGSFDLFWEKLELQRATLEVGDPELSRKRRCPQWLEVGTAVGSHPATPKILFRQQYFEAIDLIRNCVVSI